MNATPWGEREIVRMGVDLTVYRTKKASSMSWLFNMVEGDGFEPSKAEPADLQSAPFGHSGTPPGCFILEKCFPNASLKCGAHHSKLAPAVKRFSSVFTLNAAFLGKDGRKSAFCMSFIQNENTLFTGIYTT